MPYSVWGPRKSSLNSRLMRGEIKDFPGKEIGKKIPTALFRYFQRSGRPFVPPHRETFFFS